MVPRHPFLADEAVLLVRPWSGYRAVVARDRARGAGGTVALRVLLLLGVLGAFVSFTASGRFVFAHLAWTALFWSFVPALQTAAVVVAGRVVAPREPSLRVAALYHAGHAPWLLWMLAVSGMCVFVPGLFRAEHVGLLVRIFAWTLLCALAWGGVLTYAMFRAGLDLSRGRAAVGTALFYAGYAGSIVAYYLVTNQIQPQLTGGT